jgi:hypothetical protein
MSDFMNPAQLCQSFLRSRCNARAFSLEDAVHNAANRYQYPLEVIHIERDQSWFHIQFLNNIFISVTVFVPHDLNVDHYHSVFGLELVTDANVVYEMFDSHQAIIERIAQLASLTV